MRDAASERARYSDYSVCLSNFNDVTAELLKKEETIYHLECYKLATNKTFIDRLRKRPVAQPNALAIDRDNCNTKEVKIVENRRDLHSKSIGFDKTKCIICQERGGKLRKAMDVNLGKRMLDVAKALPEKGFFIRLNSIPNAHDAVANDVLYHLKCWDNTQRNVSKIKDKDNDIDQTEDLTRILAGIEIINMVKNISKENPEEFMTMSEINEEYNRLMNNEELVNYKSHIKQLLLDNVDSISFNIPKVRKAPERVFSKQTLPGVIDKQLNTKKDDYYSIFESAKLIRNEILKATDWRFTGNFEGFEIQKSLQCLIKWIIVGATDPQHRNFDKIDVKVDNISQIIMKSIKTSRQVNYKPVSPSTSILKSRLHSETPFAVGLGLHVHKETRSKKIIIGLSDLGLSIDYDRVMKIETETANSVTDTINKNNGVYVPHTILKDKQYILRSIIQIFTMIRLTAKASFMAPDKYYFKRQIAKQKYLRNLK